jgi:hypothetical protein
VTLNKNNKIKEYSEIHSLSSQARILKENTGRGKHRKYLPYVFTEQGIAMLSGLLRNVSFRCFYKRLRKKMLCY